MADTPITPGAGTLRFTGYAPLVVQSYSPDGESPLTVTSLPRLFPSQTVAFVDKNGLVTNEWYRYLSAALRASTTGVNALDPVEVESAINAVRSNTTQLQNLTTAMNARDAQNAAAAAATVATVQALANAAAPSVVAQANAIPPVQTTLPESPGGGD